MSIELKQHDLQLGIALIKVYFNKKLVILFDRKIYFYIP